MPPLVKHSTTPLSADVSWNADMMCGNFDIDTTVRNQLNGITDGFQQLMGEVIQSATGAVASLPAMIIQRANPQLYDLLTNGVLQGRLDFDKSLLSCQKMAEKMTDLAYDSAWFAGAKAENYQSIAAGDQDAIRADQKAAQQAADNGKRWVGGEKRGGKGQPPIKVVRDTTTRAGTSSTISPRPAPPRHPGGVRRRTLRRLALATGGRRLDDQGGGRADHQHGAERYAGRASRRAGRDRPASVD